jgi:hypothetical protein
MKVYAVENSKGDEKHWVAAKTPEAAIDCAIAEELEEVEEKDSITAKELSEAELDEAFIHMPNDELDLTAFDEAEAKSEEALEAFLESRYVKIPMREALNDAIKDGKEAEVLASTIFME